SAPLRRLCAFLLMPQPPLLFKEGNVSALKQSVNSFDLAHCANRACGLRMTQVVRLKMGQFSCREIDGYRVIGRFRVGAIACRMVLDAKLLVAGDDWPVALGLIVVILQHDVIGIRTGGDADFLCPGRTPAGSSQSMDS